MYIVSIINDNDSLVIHHPHFNEIKVQDGTIKKGINTVDSFSFSLLPHNPGYNEIFLRKTHVNVFNTKSNKYEFKGRALIPNDKMTSDGIFRKSFLCESKLGYLYDSRQRHGEYHNMTVAEFLQVILDNHNRQVESYKQIKLGVVTVTNSTDNVYRYLGYESTLDTIFDKLIDRLGGEIQLREDESGELYLDYLTEIGSIKETEIRIAKNLKSIEIETDPSQIISRIVPLGATIESEDETATDASQARITIASVNNGFDYIDDEEAIALVGIQEETVIWDDINNPSILKTRGQQYLQANNRVKKQHIISALDLSLIGLDIDQFDIYNYYSVKTPILQDTLRIVGKTVFINDPETNDLTFGDKLKKASEYQNEANKAQSRVAELQNTVSQQTNRIGSISAELNNAINELATTKQTLELTQQQLQNFETVTDGDITAITQSVSELLGAISEIETAINNLSQVVSAEEINQMKDGIQTNTESISSINQSILLINQSIGDLTNRVIALEEGGQ
ncbi:phage tail spike protein [Niallia circulans]|uniref:Phage tail protein n=1 Tax=Niallia circulans TaxID=1397 RepID=A0A941G8P3_NIACI|nr:phage tail spike protein [Niallia circulans]MCB5235515.1 phage tail protein [Niallia circulans]